MFQSAVSPIRDIRGDATINIVSTPHFPASPLLEPEPKSDVSTRLFENSSVSFLSEWTTDSSSNGAFHESCPDGCPDGCRCQVCHYADLYGDDSSWTTDSEAECEEEPENEFRWSATP